ncbi:hypothetical protein PENTCL1PPCAC_28934, partial [Pristionchus entomophagus]
LLLLSLLLPQLLTFLQLAKLLLFLLPLDSPLLHVLLHLRRLIVLVTLKTDDHSLLGFGEVAGVVDLVSGALDSPRNQLRLFLHILELLLSLFHLLLLLFLVFGAAILNVGHRCCVRLSAVAER